jgi:hypothetical protein
MKNQESELLKRIIFSLSDDFKNIIEDGMTDESKTSIKRLITLLEPLVSVIDNYYDFMDYKLSDDEFNLMINEFFSKIK